MTPVEIGQATELEFAAAVSPGRAIPIGAAIETDRSMPVRMYKHAPRTVQSPALQTILGMPRITII
jgi:hypothetical protein